MAQPIVAIESGIMQKGWFTVIFEGLKMGLVKTAKTADEEYEEMSFFPGGAFWAHKEPGPYKIGDVEIEKAVKSEEVDDFLWSNFIRVMGAPPGTVQNKDFTICGLNAARTRFMHQWTYKNAWFKKKDGVLFEGGSVDPVLEKFYIACDRCVFKCLS
jgi:hypothetical protein